MLWVESNIDVIHHGATSDQPEIPDGERQAEIVRHPFARNIYIT